MICCQIADKYGIDVGGVKKLIPNLRNKTEYVVHHIYLQLHFSLGMKLTKVQRVLKLITKPITSVILLNKLF